MNPFPPRLWSRIQATAQSFRQNHMGGHMDIRLNFGQAGDVTSWDIQAGEHGNEPSGMALYVEMVCSTSSGLAA